MHGVALGQCRNARDRRDGRRRNRRTVYAHLSITENRAAERRANANELWREILRLAFENPKLSDPTLNLAKFDYAG